MLLIILNFSVLVIAATLSIVVAVKAAGMALKVRRSCRRPSLWHVVESNKWKKKKPECQMDLQRIISPQIAHAICGFSIRRLSLITPAFSMRFSGPQGPLVRNLLRIRHACLSG